MSDRSDHHDAAEVRPFPASRKLVLDAGYIARRKHMIHGFLEADVSEPRRLIREHKERTGETLSFTAYAIACLGRAADADRLVHAYRDWRGRLVLFDEVDVTITVEIMLDGRPFPLVHVVRAANRHTFREIHDEIRAVQARPAESAGMGFVRVFPRLPAVVRHAAYWLLSKNPRLQKQYAGTVGLTSVGMFGPGRSGWGLGMPAHTLAVTLGGIAEKPHVVAGSIAIRELLAVTISFDHNVLDGAPAARFAQRFVSELESGAALQAAGATP
jgi:pyruvate/2-oxoglutarate dehydrogenase complex dihydrolipoamide acyltransferase (E2) component